MNKVFIMAFKAGIVGFLLICVMGIGFMAMELAEGQKSPESHVIIFQIGAFFGAFVWLLGTLFLWVEGWIFIFQGIHKRSWPLTILFIVSLIFFSVLAAYYFHIVRHRQDHSGQRGGSDS